MKNTAYALLKDFAILFAYTIAFILLSGGAQGVLYAVAHWRHAFVSSATESVVDNTFFKAAETVVLLTLFVRRRTLRLNYIRIISLKRAKLPFAACGFGLAAVTLCGITGIMTALGAVHLQLNTDYSFTEMAWYFVLFILVGFNEELLMRGIWVEHLRKKYSGFTAIAISSAVFAALHLLNPNVTLLSFANLILAGVLLAQLYLFTKNIWLATLFHLSWNFFQGPVLGFAVSGLPMQSIFIQSGKSSADVINGGAFGLEGSLITTVVMLLLIAFLAIRLNRKSQEKLPLAIPSAI